MNGTAERPQRGRVAILVLAVLPLLSGLWTTPSFANERRADLSRLVVVGDSLSAGFQNSSLLGRQQVQGYAALVAAQARVELILPLVSDPGIPNVLELDPGPPLVIEQAPGTPGVRIHPEMQVTNLAVPAATVEDALAGIPDCDFAPPPAAPPLRQIVNLLTDVVLGLPGCFIPPPAGPIRLSQVEWAEALRPTTIILWIGNNDVLGAALAGDAALVTPAAAFKRAYREVLDRLAATGASLVVANLPDVGVIPFLTPAGQVLETLAPQTGLPPAVLGSILGINAGDFLTPDAFDLIEAILLGAAPPPLPGNVVLDAAEVAAIRAATEEFNAFIAARARRSGAALVDIHRLLNRAHAKGIVVGGRRLTTEFLGGLFSLDGVHPTNTGYAIIANAFIETLNRKLDAEVPRVSVRRVMKEDPLVFPDAGHPPATPGDDD